MLTWLFGLGLIGETGPAHLLEEQVSRGANTKLNHAAANSTQAFCARKKKRKVKVCCHLAVPNDGAQQLKCGCRTFSPENINYQITSEEEACFDRGWESSAPRARVLWLTRILLLHLGDSVPGEIISEEDVHEKENLFQVLHEDAAVSSHNLTLS